ncbi:MAG: ATP phosphoribosyltransferase regulatory subunit [Solirubrobacterales bacterium]
MIHPIPPGTRDVLPDEMRELRRLETALLDVFESFDYSEVRTPTIEYAEVVDLSDEVDAGAYRFFDDRGEQLALRTDMTIPIARLVATRFGEVEPPYRLSYMANSYKAVTPQRAQLREFGQAGIELIGVNGAEGTAEVVEVMTRSLDAVGLNKAVIGLGDADLWGCLLADFSADQELIRNTASRLASHDIVGLEIDLEAAGTLSPDQIKCLIRLIQLRGGPEVIGMARGMGGTSFEASLDSLQETYDAIAGRGGADRVQVDLGLLRDLGYYSGSILEIYDPSVGQVIGGGGRYDGLMSKFGVDEPAAGFSLYVERIHKAQLEQERNGV